MKRIAVLACLAFAGCWPISNAYTARMAEDVEFVATGGTTLFPKPDDGSEDSPFSVNSAGLHLSWGSPHATLDVKPLIGFFSGIEVGGRLGLLDPDGSVHLAIGGHAGIVANLFTFTNLDDSPTWLDGKVLATFDVGEAGITLGGHAGIFDLLSQVTRCDAPEPCRVLGLRGGTVGVDFPTDETRTFIFLELFWLGGESRPAGTLSFGVAPAGL